MRHVLLGSRLQGILERLIENDALLSIDGQLVDQRRLRGNLVVERIHECLEHRRISLERLAFGQQFLLLGLLLVILGGKSRAFGFEVGAGLLVGRCGNAVLDVKQHRVEFFDARLRFFELRHRRLAAVDHLDQARFRCLVAVFENSLLIFQDTDYGVGLGQKLLKIAGKRHVAHAVGAHALGAGL